MSDRLINIAKAQKIIKQVNDYATGEGLHDSEGRT